MSTGDFQNKYASFMEGVVKSTIAETTKLFETLVDELKEELTKVKTENEALKTTCRKMEDVISKWENSKMQNAAVQCELNPGQVLPMKQEAQQPTEKKVFYILLHNPGTATQETSNVAALPSNHPVPQPAVADPQIVYTVTDPPPVQSCEDVTGSQVEQQFLIEDLRSCDDQVTSVSLSLEKAHSSQKAQNQSIETIEYIKSPSPVMDHLQMAPCADQRLTPEGTQQLVITHFQLALPSLAKIPVHKPKPSTACGPATDKRRSLEVLQKSQSSRVPHPKPPQVQNMSMETINVLNPLVPPSSYTIAAPNVGPPVPVLKSQPSEMSQIRILIPVPYSAVHKNTKRKQIEAALKKQDGQLIIQTPVLKCATKLGNVQKQPTESVQHPQSTLKQVLWTPSTHANGGPRIETTLPQTIPQPLGIQSKTVLLQDAMLLVEAMDQSKTRTLQQETVQDRRTVPEAPLPVVRTPTSTQTLTLQSPPAIDLSTNKASFVTDATKSSDAQFQIGLLPAPQQNPGAGPPEITTGAASQSIETLTLQSPPTDELSTNNASFVTDATKSSDAQFQIRLLPAPQQNPGAGPPEITTGAASQSLETLTLQSPPADELSTNKASFVTDATKSSDAQFQIGLLPAPQQNPGAGPPAITTGAASQSLETLTLQSPPAIDLSTNKASFVTDATKSSDAQFQIGLLPAPQQNPGAGPPEITTGAASQSIETLTLQSPPADELSTNKASFVTDATKSSDAQFQIRLLPAPQQNSGAGPPAITTGAAGQSLETLTLQSPPAVELSTNKAASFVTNATKSSDAQFQIGLLPEPQQNPGAGPPEIPTGSSSTDAASQSPETLTLQSPPADELSTNKASFVTDATKSSDAQFQIGLLPAPQQNPGAGLPEITTGPSSTGAASQSPETLTLQSPPAVELSTNKASFVTDATKSSDAQFQIGLLPEPQQNPGAGPPEIPTGPSSTDAASQSPETLTLQSPPADELSTNKASFVTDATKSSDAQFQIGLLPAPQQNPGAGLPEIPTGPSSTGAASQSPETLTLQSPPAVELSTNKAASFVTNATKSSDAQFQIGLLPEPQQNPGAGPPEISTGPSSTDAASQSPETLTLQSPPAVELSTNKASFVTNATKSSDAQFQIGLLPEPQQNPGAGPPEITTGPSSTGAASQSPETLTLQSPPAVELSTNKASFVTDATKSSDAQFQIGLLPEPQQNPGAGPPEIPTGPSSTGAASQSPETLTLQSPPGVELSTNKASFVTDATKSSDAQFQIGLLPEPQQNPGAGPPEITTGPSSTGAASQSLEQLETTPDPEPVPSKNIVFNKLQPSHPQFKFCPLSSNQISEVVSTVAASQSDCTSLASLPQKEKDVSTMPSPPLVTSDPTNQSSDQGSCKKIKIIIRKAANAVARPAQVSETQADLTPSPVPPVTAPSQVSEAQVDLTPSSGSPVTTPSQEQNTNASDEKQTAPSQEQNTNDTDEKQTAPSQEQNTNAPDEKQTVPSPEQMPSDSPTPPCQQLESSSEELAVREITPEEMPAVLETENVPGDGSPLVPIIRLKRLASLDFSAESSLQSQEKVSPSVPPEGPPSTPSSISDPDSETSPFPTEGSPSWSTAGQLILEETSDDSLLPEKPEPCFTPEEEETPATTLLESTPPCVSEPVLVETKQSEQQDSPAVPVQESETSTLGAEMVNEAERDCVPASATSSSPEQLTVFVKDSTPQPEDPQPTKTHFLAQLEISPVLDEAQMESAVTQSPGEGTSSDWQRKSPRLSIVTHLHPKKKLLGKRRKKTEPLTESPKKAKSDKQSTTKQQCVSVSTNTSSPLSPPGPKTEAEHPQISSKNQGSKEIGSPPTKPVPIDPRKPVVSLYRLPLKDHTERALISAALPQNRVLSRDVSLPKGQKTGGNDKHIPEKSLVREASASKPLESAVSLKSNLTSGMSHVEKKKLFKQKRSAPETSIDKSGNCNGSPGADATRDRVARSSLGTEKPKMFRRGKARKEVKTTSVCLRSSTSKDYSRPETRSLSLKVGPSLKKKHRLQGQSSPKKMAPGLRKNLSKLFSSSEDSESASVSRKDSSPDKVDTSSRKSQLAVASPKSSSLNNFTIPKKSSLASTSQIQNVASPVRSQFTDAGEIENGSSSANSKDSISAKNIGSSKDSQLPAISQKESSSVKTVSGPKKSQSPDVSLNKSSSVKTVSGPKKFQSPDVSLNKSSSVKTVSGPKKSQSPDVSLNKSSSVKTVSGPKKSQSPNVSLNKSSSVKNATIPTKSQLPAAGEIENVASPTGSQSPDVSLEYSSSGEYVTSPTKSKLQAVGQNQFRSVKNVASSQKLQLSAVGTKECSSVKNGTSSKKSPFADVSQKKSSSVKNVSSLKKSKLPDVSPKDSSSVKNFASSQNSQIPAASQKGSSSAKNDTSFKKSPLPVGSQKRSSQVKNASSPKSQTIGQTPSIATPKKSKLQTIGHKQSSRDKNVARAQKSQSPETNQKECGSIKKFTIPKKSPLAAVSKKESSSLEMSQSPAFGQKESSSVKKVRGLKRSQKAEVNKTEVTSFELIVGPQRYYIPPVNPLLYKVIPMSQLLGGSPNDDPCQSQKSQSAPNSPRPGTSKQPSLSGGSSSKGAESQKRGPGTPVGKTSAAARPAKAAKTGESDESPAKRARRSPGENQAKTPRSRRRPISAKKAQRPPRPPPPPPPVKWDAESNGGYELPKPGQPLLRNQCGYCGRVLSGGCALESHVSLHTGYRPYSCVMCGKTFTDGKGLRRHARVHSSGRMHICQECGKGFVYGFGLTKHVQMVHGKIKPFVCQLCNKSFFTKRDVETHIRAHTGEKPFACHLCEKRFMRRMELNIHLRWHRGEKRHWCPHCGKGFLDQNNLKRHKYIHTGEKPHACPHCPKHFTQSGHLKKHVKTVHKML